MSELDQSKRFLHALFENKPENHHVLIWRLHGRHSRFFTDLDSAALYATAGDRRDFYVGVGLSPADFGPDKRCTAEEVTGIGGLWCDIDISHPAAHAKANLPPDEAAALRILAQIAVRATLIVDSGYGLQAWWLFKEPWIFTDAGERARARDLAQRWNQYVRSTAQRLKFEADSVGDLARVLRLPGTLNGKQPDEPRRVRVKWGKEERRYNPSDLAEIIADIEPAAGPDAAGENGSVDWRRGADTGLVIHPDREPPAEKFKLLWRDSKKFKITWEHKRTEFADQSGSSYDMALAAIAIRHQWSDQETVDLLIAHQRKYPLDSAGKVRGVRGVRDRPRYFLATIAKARHAAQPNPSIEKLRAAAGAAANGAPPASAAAPVHSSEPPPPSPPPPSPPGDRLSELSGVLKVKILRILKQLSDPPLYQMETERGTVYLGEVQNLIEQRALRNRIAQIGVYIGNRSKDEWEIIAQSLLDCCEPVEVTDENTFNGAARAWLRDYLAETITMDTLEEADRGQNPFVKDGALLLSGAGIRKFLMMNNGERQLTTRDLSQALRAIGAKPITVFLETAGKRTTRSLWKLPGKPDEYQ